MALGNNLFYKKQLQTIVLLIRVAYGSQMNDKIQDD